MKPLTAETVAPHGTGERLEVMAGPAFFNELRETLNPGGVALRLNEGIGPDRSGPWDMAPGDLTYSLQGVPMARCFPAPSPTTSIS